MHYWLKLKNNNVIIRPATINDIPEILEITNDAILHTTAIYDYDVRTLEEQKDWFLRKQEKGHPVFVAQNDQKVIGFATYGNFREKIGYQFTMEHSVYVRKDFSGNGIGKSLMVQLIAYAKSNSVQSLIGVIDADNISSIVFHEKLGFEVVGYLKRVGFKFEKWLDVKLLQLQLK